MQTTVDRKLLGSRILIVDDEEANLRVLVRLLEQRGYTNVKTLSDPREVLPTFFEWDPDLILLDLHMPHIDGWGVLAQLSDAKLETSYLPVLMLTADATRETKQRALSIGAKDFLSKPFDATEVLLRIDNLLHTRLLHLELEHYNRALEARVLERTQELDKARYEIIERLALAAEFRDDDTHQHTWRVGQMAAYLAKAADLPSADVEVIRRAAPLHDVGKIGIPDAILLKPGKLTPDEFAHMKTHTTIGARILSQSEFTLLQVASEIALTHHERWDGNGYPNRLAGDEIPIVGRIVAVVDVFDALTHERPYKPAWPVGDALAEMERQRGTQFDATFVDVLLDLRRRSAPGEKEWRELVWSEFE
jgi:putative two-component system response regulator